MKALTNIFSVASCIMPTYNRWRFVLQAIKYFLRQDYEPKELIIIDGGTTIYKGIEFQ